MLLYYFIVKQFKFILAVYQLVNLLHVSCFM
jgi:hypothetical protein